MHSRLLPAPWPPQRGLARRGNGPCSILTRRPSAVAGPATARLPGSHWEGWCAVAGPACSSSKLPPIQESRQRPPPRCYRLAAAPTQRCVWPAALMITCAQAQLIMLLAALHQTSDTFLHSPHDALPSSIPRTPASLRHPVATFIPKCVHLVINGTLLIPPWCSILSFVRPSPPPCQTWSVRSEAPTWASPTFQALFHAQEEQHAFPRLSRRLPAGFRLRRLPHGRVRCSARLGAILPAARIASGMIDGHHGNSILVQAIHDAIRESTDQCEP
jgi:hypothetical protein